VRYDLYIYVIMRLKVNHILPPAKLLTQMHEKYTIKTACTNGLNEDEHVMFETCRRQRIELKH